MFTSELELLRRLKNDDDVSFKVIFNKYYPRLYYFVLEFLPFDDIAENIVQDIFLTLWKKRHDLIDDTNLGAYLFTVAKNSCLYTLRSERYRRKIFPERSFDMVEVDSNITALSIIDSSVYTFDEIEQIIEKTLDELPPQCRRVFVLSRFEEKKNREIAEELDISVKVVEKHISKGIKAFRIALKDYIPFIAYLLIS